MSCSVRSKSWKSAFPSVCCGGAGGTAGPKRTAPVRGDKGGAGCVGASEPSGSRPNTEAAKRESLLERRRVRACPAAVLEVLECCFPRCFPRFLSLFSFTRYLWASLSGKGDTARNGDGEEGRFRGPGAGPMAGDVSTIVAIRPVRLRGAQDPLKDTFAPKEWAESV
jgi:hypothetical protein